MGDKDGLLEKIMERTDRENGSMGISAQIIRMIKSFEIDGLSSIGIGSIGPIDICTGSILNTPNLPFKSIPVLEPLTFEFHVPVRMLNDCSAAVLGEKRFGAGKGLRHLVYVTLSTGLGGGAIVDGNLLVGKDGNAVEVGHLTIEADSPLACGCGKKGHWEAYSSGKNIPNFAMLLLRDTEIEGSLLLKLAGGSKESITSEILFTAAKKHDIVALKIVNKIGKVNAIGFANVVNIFDPQLITVGGSVALENPDLILEPILENIEKHTINRIPEIIITPLEDEAVLYGGLAMAIQYESHK
jgi:glucokinase